MIEFSANLGFLWTDRSLPEAIVAAKNAGFAAVECHWPYDTPAQDLTAALANTGLPMLGLNTRRGNVNAGENGLSALSNRKTDARAAITEAISYAKSTGTKAVHVMAGFAHGPVAKATFVENLQFAAASASDLAFLIEPLNRHDAPGYFLTTTDQAVDILGSVDAPNVKLMFDCYHVGRTEGDVVTRLKTLQEHIGHIQFAGVPKRGRPDEGELNYGAVFAAIKDMAWQLPLGAEYRPTGDTDSTLGWMQSLGSA